MYIHAHRRTALIERLQVESKLQTGLWRLLSYIALFVLIVVVTRIGTPAYQRRAVGTLLEDALFLTEFGTLNRLEDVRDFLPKFSSAVKRFSASSSLRFKDADAYQLLGIHENINANMHKHIYMYTYENTYTCFHIYVRVLTDMYMHILNIYIQEAKRISPRQ